MDQSMLTLAAQFGGFGIMALFFGFTLRWLTVQITKDIRLLSHTIKNQAGMLLLLTRTLLLHDAQARGVLNELDITSDNEAARKATHAYNDLMIALDSALAEMRERAARREHDADNGSLWGFK